LPFHCNFTYTQVSKKIKVFRLFSFPWKITNKGDILNKRHKGAKGQRHKEEEAQRHRGTKKKGHRGTKKKRHKGTEAQRDEDV